jgi:hydroxymethylglutaryl-CoA synthase
VAFLIEANPTLLSLELSISGSASDYRGPDFRKPFSRFMRQQPAILSQPRDFPVFNGKYSTTCYIDEVLAAMRHLFSRINERPSAFMRGLAATFLHRPYQRMAETGLIMSYLLALALGGSDDEPALRALAESAEVDAAALVAELTRGNDLFALVQDQDISRDMFPLASATARAFRQTPAFRELMTDLGAHAMTEVGNLYTASLPAWMAAGIEQAFLERRNLAGARILTVGYGSGDAAEAIPMRVVEGWESAASRIGFAETLTTAVDLDQGAYERLHDGSEEVAPIVKPGVFYIDHIGRRQSRFDDSGIEYYRFGA